MLLDTIVFLHAYVITYFLVTPCSRRFTLIGNHLTPCEIYLFNIRTLHCNMFYAYISIPSFCILFLYINALLYHYPKAQGSPVMIPIFPLQKRTIRYSPMCLRR